MYEVDIKKLTKIERIKLLNLYDINTLDYTLFKKNTDFNIIKNHINKYNRISVRTQNPVSRIDLGLPKLINIDPQNNTANIRSLSESHDILVSEAVNPDDCIKCGNIALLNDKIIIEIVYGSGTLDRLTREGQVDQHWNTRYNNYRFIIPDQVIVNLIRKLEKLPFSDIVVEFSYYNNTYGILNKRYVIWEFINY